MLKSSLSILLLVIFLASIVSCAANNDATKTVENLLGEIAALDLEIDTIIGAALCEDNSQCGYVEIGHKACGGPAGFKIYSFLNTDTTLLIEKSQKHVSLSKNYNELTGLDSDCSIEQPPIVICNIKCISEQKG